jgi:hypothetical protein
MRVSCLYHRKCNRSKKLGISIRTVAPTHAHTNVSISLHSLTLTVSTRLTLSVCLQTDREREGEGGRGWTSKFTLRHKCDRQLFTVNFSTSRSFLENLHHVKAGGFWCPVIAGGMQCPESECVHVRGCVGRSVCVWVTGGPTWCGVEICTHLSARLYPRSEWCIEIPTHTADYYTTVLVRD